MFYSIIMMNGAVTRAGARCWHHWQLKTTEALKICRKTYNKNIAEFLVMSSHVTTLKHKVEQWLISWKWLFVCLFPEAAESDVFGWKAAIQLRILVSVHERAPLNSCLLKPAFFVECWSIWYASKPPLFSASSGLSNELQLSWLHCLH